MDLAPNVGRTDKNIRIGLGILLIVIGLFKSFGLVILGIVILATGLLSFCGLYKVLGINTASKAERQTAKPDLSDRATDNFNDFKHEAVETVQELKEKAVGVAKEVKEEANAKTQEWKANANEAAAEQARQQAAKPNDLNKS
ncbi:YgaP family membrane protein [Thiothrix eikelboomii]|uniref:YgaP family membrane protein n=1 Tax=Thiothrix eikelboomii TaxID=92487 RepID=UPI003BAF4ED3